MRRQVGLRGRGAGDAVERVVGEQAKQLQKLGAPLTAQSELVERPRVARFEARDVELDHARERVALDELLRGRAQRALGVEDDLTLVDVDAQDRHAGLPGRGWSDSAREARRIALPA